jgi:hypothetical protein
VVEQEAALPGCVFLEFSGMMRRSHRGTSRKHPNNRVEIPRKTAYNQSPKLVQQPEKMGI